jgi:hypothetical protein
MWTMVFTVALQVLGWVLNKNSEDKQMQELFYKFIERQHEEYLNSARMRVNAQNRMKSILEKPFVETV